MRFELGEAPDDISRTADLLRHGLERTPAGSLSAARFLANLGGVLLRAYEADGNPEHLAEATDHLRAAHSIQGDSSRSKATSARAARSSSRCSARCCSAAHRARRSRNW